MKQSLLLIGAFLLAFSCTNSIKNDHPKKVIRQGMLIGVYPDKIEEYVKLHANPWKEIDSLLKVANIQNYSIYLKDTLLFGYWEYTGDNYEKDMEQLGAHPKIKEWLKLCNPCQNPVPTRKEGEWWAIMDEVYHLD